MNKQTSFILRPYLSSSSPYFFASRASCIMRRINLYLHVDTKSCWASWVSEHLVACGLSNGGGSCSTLLIYSSSSLFYSVSGPIANYRSSNRPECSNARTQGSMIFPSEWLGGRCSRVPFRDVVGEGFLKWRVRLDWIRECDIHSDGCLTLVCFHVQGSDRATKFRTFNNHVPNKRVFN